MTGSRSFECCGLEHPREVVSNVSFHRLRQHLGQRSFLPSAYKLGLLMQTNHAAVKKLFYLYV
ncbi:hypothetical protein OIU79_004866 [Salix purpurea]|uniref:Uncharacterized protein n=1 Tax=Salix purpurea TaxID=77065 RepID=A0A9Q0UBA6_SALPP|nr:hypothetical protein OIU79_004866 [Salix purpurea]